MADAPDDVNPDDEAPEADGGGDKQREPFDEARAREALNKKNREAQQLRERLKELEPLAQKARELEEAGKSDLEKLSGERDSFRDRASSAEQRLSRLDVALEAAPEGISVTLLRQVAKRISGGTAEEMQADAEELFALLAPASAPDRPADVVPGRPKERLRGGSDPEDEPDEMDPAKLAAKIRSARN
ncbi:hypothetical protein [Kineococcus radiotolerans]|uniref:Scaffolding protein n=1 Tax=Kineococcus radiotolerans (strain ATCC BAA-149 / DSM 14245 / SRS30216) TaxID=266940 RepID=A6W8R7_KINRD|nr:hypothetical protein [Kineococcus radiotolerans]ABS03206.1 hypothetical protein Krad_1720 [Kineococcus radiotolerans SRS30216 = ATCC BAA-149]